MSRPHFTIEHPRPHYESNHVVGNVVHGGRANNISNTEDNLHTLLSDNTLKLYGMDDLSPPCCPNMGEIPNHLICQRCVQFGIHTDNEWQRHELWGCPHPDWINFGEDISESSEESVINIASP